MQHELESLERRIASLEDDELEVMERLEEAQAELAEARGRSPRPRAAGRADGATRDEKVAGIDEQTRRRSRRRGPAVEGVPADLLALYDRLRDQKGGVGAAELRARQCGGCRLGLDAPELTRSRASPRTRWSAARSASGSWCARPSPACDPPGRRRGRRWLRGNPGPAAYGAVLRDADTGAVIAEEGTTIGIATNNVAEYRAHRRAPARGDRRARGGHRGPDGPKLVVEQMSGRWKIKHRTCARWPPRRAGWRRSGRRTPGCRASRTSTPTGSPTRALDGTRSGVTVAERGVAGRGGRGPGRHPGPGWGGCPARRPPSCSCATASPRTRSKARRSGQRQPRPVSDDGRDQVRAVAEWLAPIADPRGRRGGVSGAAHAGVRRDPRARLGHEVAVEPGVR